MPSDSVAIAPEPDPTLGTAAVKQHAGHISGSGGGTRFAVDVWLAAPVTCPDCGGDVIIRADFEHALLGGGRSTACRSANQGEGFEPVDQTAAAAHIGDVEGLWRHRFWPPIDGALSDVG